MDKRDKNHSAIRQLADCIPTVRQVFYPDIKCICHDIYNVKLTTETSLPGTPLRACNNLSALHKIVDTAQQVFQVTHLDFRHVCNTEGFAL